MEKEPRNSKGSLFSGTVGVSIVYQGILQAAITLLVYFFSFRNFGRETAITMAFLVLGLIQLFHVMNVRSSTGSIFTRQFFSNRLLFGSLAFAALLQISVVLIPGLNTIFRTVPLTGLQWLAAVASAFAIIPLTEIAKVIIRALPKGR